MPEARKVKLKVKGIFLYLVTSPSIKLPAAVASNPVGEAKTGLTGPPPPLPLIIYLLLKIFKDVNITAFNYLTAFW